MSALRPKICFDAVGPWKRVEHTWPRPLSKDLRTKYSACSSPDRPSMRLHPGMPKVRAVPIRRDDEVRIVLEAKMHVKRCN